MSKNYEFSRYPIALRWFQSYANNGYAFAEEVLAEYSEIKLQNEFAAAMYIRDVYIITLEEINSKLNSNVAGA